jgi:hypothetical protein
MAETEATVARKGPTLISSAQSLGAPHVSYPGRMIAECKQQRDAGWWCNTSRHAGTAPELQCRRAGIFVS